MIFWFSPLMVSTGVTQVTKLCRGFCNFAREVYPSPKSQKRSLMSVWCLKRARGLVTIIWRLWLLTWLPTASHNSLNTRRKQWISALDNWCRRQVKLKLTKTNKVRDLLIMILTTTPSLVPTTQAMAHLWFYSRAARGTITQCMRSSVTHLSRQADTSWLVPRLTSIRSVVWDATTAQREAWP